MCVCEYVCMLYLFSTKYPISLCYERLSCNILTWMCYIQTNIILHVYIIYIHVHVHACIIHRDHINVHRNM